MLFSVKLKNGYEKDILSMKESLKKLSAILLEKKDLPSFKVLNTSATIRLSSNHQNGRKNIRFGFFCGKL